MRIRKRLPPPCSALSNPPLHRSEAAQSYVHHPLQTTVIVSSSSNNNDNSNNKNAWDLSKNDNTEEKKKKKDFANVETLKDEETKRTGGANKTLKPSSSSSSSSSCHEEEYTVVPLKKRKSTFHVNPKQETMSEKMESKTNKKFGDISREDKSKKGNVTMEGSRCSRVNGRGWRCSRTTLLGYSLCEHHLGKGRLIRSMASAADGGGESRKLMVTKKRTKVGVVKARSISSLLAQI